VVFNGATTKQSYLLVATERRKGIECPKIWATGAPNYWIAAWRQAQPGGAGPVGAPIGLGINGAKQRSQHQLHIHMATLLAGVRPQLQQLEKKGEITNQLAKWDQSVVEVKGLEWDPKSTKLVSDWRAYRAMWVPNLTQNLFAVLNKYVPAARQDMSLQMMAVTARMDPQTKLQNGFYVLNSDPNLKGQTHGVGGISACDQLFNWG
jgi:CDP-diacylglycerol pyrophosphatase